MPKLSHGMSGTRTFNAWNDMIQRCTNPKKPKYKNYGGRGITVCDKWKTFLGFLEDMGICPDGLSLERQDTNKGYDKQNCMWATQTRQQLNRTPRTVTGVNGVNWNKQNGKWRARGMLYDQIHNLYNGPDFFEAVCARKSWDNRVKLILAQGE